MDIKKGNRGKRRNFNFRKRRENDFINLETIADIITCGALTGFTRNEILEYCSWLIETAKKSM